MWDMKGNTAMVRKTEFERAERNSARPIAVDTVIGVATELKPGQLSTDKKPSGRYSKVNEKAVARNGQRQVARFLCHAYQAEQELAERIAGSPVSGVRLKYGGEEGNNGDAGTYHRAQGT